MTRLLRLIEFLVFYLWEVLVSNVRVAYDVLTPRHLMRPQIITLGVKGLTDRQVLVLANLITMTPGTLSLDLSADRERLTIHGMYVKDEAEAQRELEDNYVRRVCRVF